MPGFKINLGGFKFFPLVLLLAVSCGIEDYAYIYPIPQAEILPQMNNRAVVLISDRNRDNPRFLNFVIFYRIYVSNVLQGSTTSRDTFSSINPALASDHNLIQPYIDSDTLVNTNMDALFKGRRYWYLGIYEGNIDGVLSASALGGSLVFDFTHSKNPTMEVHTAGVVSTFTLFRSTGDGIFTPRPDRFFVNHDDIWRPEYINDQFNADVVNMSGIPAGANRYTYVAMYIAAMGIDPASYSYIYSTPSLIHVFQLPETW